MKKKNIQNSRECTVPTTWEADYGHDIHGYLSMDYNFSRFVCV